MQSGHLTVPSESTTLTALLGDSIRFGAAPSDGAALACAHRAAGADGGVDLELVTEADTRLTAVKLPREVREASTRTGRAVLATASAAIGGTALHDYSRARQARRLAREPRGRRRAAERLVERAMPGRGRRRAVRVLVQLGGGGRAARPSSTIAALKRCCIGAPGDRRRGAGGDRPRRRSDLQLHAAAGRDVDAARGSRAASVRKLRKEPLPMTEHSPTRSRPPSPLAVSARRAWPALGSAGRSAPARPR